MLKEDVLFSLVLLAPDISCDSHRFSANDDNSQYQMLIQQCHQPQLNSKINELIYADRVYQFHNGGLAEPSYWLGWQSEQQVDPLLSHSLSSSHFGIGFWLYDENSDSNELSAIIKDYGIQVSVGLGNSEIGAPRVRLDYRWHEDDAGDIIMQLDLPF
jgi:hypothetical protein